METQVTPRSDIYGLGMVLYELFTGRRYSGEGEMPEVAAGSLLLFESLPSMDAGFAVERRGGQGLSYKC